MSSDDNRQQVINDARTMLAWLEEHVEVELPHPLTSDMGFQICTPTTKDEMAALARQFGECEKEFVDNHFYLRKRFGSVSIFGFTARQQVCERVVVGTEEVPEETRPAYVREIVEWKCSSLLGDDNE